MWLQVARYQLSVKLKSQVQKLGVPQKPTPPLGSMVMVKRKKWHRDSPLSTPFRTMQLLCPSPMMTSGWLVGEGDQVVHARVALLPDHQAEVAIRQWEEVENPQAPTRRLRGKQPVLKPEVDLPHGYPVRIVPPGEVPAPLADQEDDYEIESPSQGPALHALQGECHGTAGGEDTRFSSLSSSTSFSNFRQEALCQCVECGTHQMKSLGVCRLCEEPLPSGDESPSIAEVYDLPETAWLNPASAALWEEEATDGRLGSREWGAEEDPLGVAPRDPGWWEWRSSPRMLDEVLAGTAWKRQRTQPTTEIEMPKYPYYYEGGELKAPPHSTEWDARREVVIDSVYYLIGYCKWCTGGRDCHRSTMVEVDKLDVETSWFPIPHIQMHSAFDYLWDMEGTRRPHQGQRKGPRASSTKRTRTMTTDGNQSVKFDCGRRQSQRGSVVGLASIVTCNLWMFFEKFEYVADMPYWGYSFSLCFSGQFLCRWRWPLL